MTRGRLSAPSTRPTARSMVASSTSSEGAKRSTSGRGALVTRPASSSCRQRASAQGSCENGGQQQTFAPHRRHPGQGGEAPAQVSSGQQGPGRDVFGLHDRQRGPGGGHGQRLTSEGAAVVARMEGGGHLGAGPARSHRHAVAQRLGHGHHVGVDAPVLEPEPPAGPAQTGLDLVHHQEDVPLGAQGPQAAEVVRRRNHHPRLTLHRFDEDGGHPLGVAGLLHGPEVVEGNVDEALGHRGERLLLAGWPVAARVASVRPWKASQVLTTA